MKHRLIWIMCIVFLFSMDVTAGRAAPEEELSSWVGTIKCGCCDLLEKGDTVLKVIQCMGQPDYREIEEIPANPFRTSEMVPGAEYWYYKKNHWTYRIKIVNGLVRGIEEIPPE